MRLSDFKGAEALCAFADLLEPAAEILTDKMVEDQWKKNNKMGAIAMAIRNHQKAVTTILAVLNKEDPETFEPSMIDIPVMALEVLNDPALQAVFQSQAQMTAGTPSGSATESTQGIGA